MKNYMLGSLLRGFDGPLLAADRLRSVLEFDLDLNSYYKEYIHTIKNINSLQLQELANKYLDESSLVELVVGKK